jgi:hypothetical protein
MIDNKDTLRQDKSALIALLEQVGAKFRGNTCCCPFHGDTHPSAGIFKGDDGAWRFKCQSCGVFGDIYDIEAKTSQKSLGEVLGGNKAPAARQLNGPLAFPSVWAVKEYLDKMAGRIVGEYKYGEDFTVYRCEANGVKTYRPVSLSDKGYVLGFPKKPWRLYSSIDKPSLTEATTVIVVEGEKCADMVSRYGFTATTSAGGAKNAKNSDWTPLAGKAVTLWPDNDIDGKRYMADVQEILQSLTPPARVSILDPANADLAEKEDAANLISQLTCLRKQDAEITLALSEFFKTAKVLSTTTELQQRLDDIKSGRYTLIDWPWESLSFLTKSLLPGTVTLLVGNPGASKSFMALQAFSYWNETGLRSSLYEVEEDKVFHLTRALAQKAGESGLTDIIWQRDNGEKAAQLMTENQPFIDSFGRVLYASPDAQPTLTQLAEWVEAKAKTGCRIIGIDPITAAAREGDVWIADSRFLQSIKRTATDYHCSIVLVTHPIKAVSFPDLSQIAGSAAYQRFSQTILWLESHDEKESQVKTAFGTAPANHNRTVHILKARNGKGMGKRLAYQFDGANLSLNELGFVIKEKKAR